MTRALTALLALLAATATVATQNVPGTLPPLADVLSRAGETVERYYARAQSIMAIETVVQQPLRFDLTPDGSFARRLVYERRIAWEAATDGAAPEAHVRRDLLRMNDRAPRPKDKPRCFDPAPTEPDAMQMLLPANRADYTFAIAGVGRTDDRQALMLDYREKKPGPITFRKKEHVDDCYFVDMPGAHRGRIWLALDTFEVLRIDSRLTAPVSVRRSAKALKSRSDLEATFDRDDSSTVYRAVAFADPDETVMLPASIVSLTVQTNTRQRETTTFTNYRRFVTEGRVVDQ